MTVQFPFTWMFSGVGYANGFVVDEQLLKDCGLHWGTGIASICLRGCTFCESSKCFIIISCKIICSFSFDLIGLSYSNPANILSRIFRQLQHLEVEVTFSFALGYMLVTLESL